MKIKFVGTSSGKTSLNRFHSSLLFTSLNYNLLVDTGDGISRALLSQKIDINSINGIILTHLHPDHFAGLPSLLIQMKLMNRNKPLEIFIHHGLKDFVEYVLIQSYILSERLKFEISFKVFDTENPLHISNNLFCLARQNSHLNKLDEYKVKYPSLKLVSTSLLFASEEKKIVYTSDINSKDDLCLFSQMNPEVMIVDANHLDETILAEAIHKINSGLLYLTHYSDEDSKKLAEILALLDSDNQKRTLIAEDGHSFEI